MADKAQIPGDVLNGYCWISSTFTLPKHFEVNRTPEAVVVDVVLQGEPGVDNLHHGVGPEEEGDERVYHAYYQWVPFFLSFQVFVEWGNWEVGKTLISNLGYHVLLSSLGLENDGREKI